MFYRRDNILQVIDLLSGRYLQGKVRAIRLALTGLLSGGHLLIEDLPGLGKTSLALALSGVLGLQFGRIQATSDLLPSDITGLSVLNRETQHFHFVKGPIFSNLVLVDEINRSMPKTQSALLEAMEEHRVTVEGVTYPLPDPFMVIATQNPVEQIGTFPLPESQMDRFLLTTGIGYPPADLEQRIIRQGSAREQLATLEPLLGLEEILSIRRFVREEIRLEEPVAVYIHSLLEASRQDERILTGISTRGGLSLAAAARVEAYLNGRGYVIPEDVQRLAGPVAGHRLILHPEFAALAKDEVIRSLLAELPVPLA